MRLLVFCVVVGGCGPGEGTDTGSPPGTGETGGQTTEVVDWCQVQATFNNRCLTCHAPHNLQGDLDLQTDPHAAIVGVVSETFGAVLVEPGDRDGSLLYRKMAGTQAESEGYVMPLAGTVASATETVGLWIDQGATADCAETSR